MNRTAAMQSVVDLVNRFLKRFFSGPLALVHVVEYPKCGGTWTARLLRSYIGVDRAFGLTRPVGRHSVVQEHCLYRPWYRRPVVVVRDPRDTMVSFYFHEIYSVPDAKLMRAIGFESSAGDVRNLEAYVRFKIEHPLETEPGFSYADFADAWIGKPHTVVVQYEKLHRDTAGELARLLRELGYSPDAGRVASSVAENSFLAITGRRPGEEDRAHHKRKGIVGDWKNYFTPELSRFVLRHQGDLLRKLGYAADGQNPPAH